MVAARTTLGVVVQTREPPRAESARAQYCRTAVGAEGCRKRRRRCGFEREPVAAHLPRFAFLRTSLRRSNFQSSCCSPAKAECTSPRAHFTDGQTESARGQMINLSVEVLAQNQFVLQTLTLIPEGLGTFCRPHSAPCDLHPEKT